MKVLAVILAFIFFVLFTSSRMEARHNSNRRRALGLSLLLTIIVTIQLFYFFPRPTVDYVKIGWIGQIHQLNEKLQRKGNPNRIPMPGGN
jgi:hypothetical protein